jgi:hypothetical protein
MYHRIDALSAMVDLSPGTFVQYQGIEGRELLLELSKEEMMPCTEAHLDEFFYSYENLPEHSEMCFDAYEELALEDCEYEKIPLDLGLDSMYIPRVLVEYTNKDVQDVVNRTFHTEHDNVGNFVPPTPPYDIFHIPSERAIYALLDCNLLPPVAHSTGGSSTKPVILDTGASMAISPDASDFVEPPRPLKIPIALGGGVSWYDGCRDGNRVMDFHSQRQVRN